MGKGQKGDRSQITEYPHGNTDGGCQTEMLHGLKHSAESGGNHHYRDRGAKPIERAQGFMGKRSWDFEQSFNQQRG